MKIKSHYLDKIINDDIKLAYCFAEPNIRFDIHSLNCEVNLEENKYLLKEKILVVAADQASSIIVPADKDKNVYLVKIDNTSKTFANKYKIIDDSNAVDYEFDDFEFNENDILVA